MALVNTIIQFVLYTMVLLSWTLSSWITEAALYAMVSHLVLGGYQLFCAALMLIFSRRLNSAERFLLDRYLFSVVMYFTLLWPVSYASETLWFSLYIFALPLIPGAILFRLSFLIWKNRGVYPRNRFLPNLTE